MQGQQNFSTSASEYNAESFRSMRQIMRLNTAEPVQVVAFHANAGGIGTVDVLPLVRLVAGDEQTLDQSQLFELPVMRVQAGANALIIDPQPGDIGLAVYAMRDIEAVKATRGGPVNPASARCYDKGDGFYIGGFLNKTPARYVKVSDSGVEIEGVVKVDMHGQNVTITAEGKITLDAPVVEITGTLTQTGAKGSGASSFTGGFTNTGGSIVSNGITLERHTHGGVEPGGGSTGGPQ